MKKFLVSVLQRLGDLIIKMISIKGVSALIVTYIGLQERDLGHTILVVVMWSLMVGFRYAEKVSKLVKGA